MSDNKGLPTIAVIAAAALALVLGTYLIPSGAFATVLPSDLQSGDSGDANNENVSSISSSEEAQPMSSENANDGGSQAVQQPTGEDAYDEGTGGITASDGGSNDNQASDGGSNDNQASDGGSNDSNGKDGGSKDDGSSDKVASDDEKSNDEGGDTSSTSDDGSSKSTESGVPGAYLDEYSTCVSDLSTDDSVLTQDDVVDCYGQVFGPNPTHDLGPLEQEVPASTSSMPGFENMPSAMQQPQSGQPQQQGTSPTGDNQQQQMQPLGQTQPQDQQQMQPLGQTQPHDGQPQLQSYNDQQQMLPLGQTQPQPQNQQQMSPSQLPIGSGVLDVNSIKDLVKSRLGLGQ